MESDLCSMSRGQPLIELKMQEELACVTQLAG